MDGPKCLTLLRICAQGNYDNTCKIISAGICSDCIYSGGSRKIRWGVQKKIKQNSRGSRGHSPPDAEGYL